MRTEKENSIIQVVLGQPVAADNDRIVVSATIANGAQTIAAQPDCPRNITITVTDANASISAGTVTVVGTDSKGRSVQEVLTFPTLTLTGTKIFASITSVTVSGLVGNGVGDTIIVGVGNVIGLPNDISSSTSIKNVYLGGTRVASPTIATGQSSSGVDSSSSTYDGSKILLVIFDEDL